MQQFVDWLTTRPGRDGRLCDRSIANALTPLRLALDAAVAEGLLDANPASRSCCRAGAPGRAWSTRERRFLTRAELVRLLDEVPAKWRPLFELLAATGLRISEAIGAALERPRPRRRRAASAGHAARSSRASIGRAEVSARRAADPADARARRDAARASAGDAADDAFVFPGREGGPSDQGAFAAACSSPPPSARDCPGSAFTRCVTPAPRCSSSRV